MSDLKKLILLITIIYSSNVCNTYDLGNIAPCQSSFKQQSPIDILESRVIYRENRNFRIISSNYTNLNTTWQVIPEEKTVGFQGKFGYSLFMKDWAIYKFNLEKIYFRTTSGHKIEGMNYDIEMELVHRLDTSYRTPGRYIHPDSEYLVISTFFVKKEMSRDDMTSRFFEYANLDTFVINKERNDIYFKNKLKLNQMIQNQPGYLYTGTLSQGFCDTAWRMILPKFQLITSAEYDTFQTLMKDLNFLNTIEPDSNNARDLQPINVNTEIYTNVELTSRLLPEANQNQFDFSVYVNLNLFVLLLSMFIIF